MQFYNILYNVFDLTLRVGRCCWYKMEAGQYLVRKEYNPEPTNRQCDHTASLLPAPETCRVGYPTHDAEKTNSKHPLIELRTKSKYTNNGCYTI